MIGSPESDATRDIWRSTTHRRAVEAIIWGIPAVNYLLMAEEANRRVQCAPNEVVYWSRLLDGRNQTLTPNPDAVYLMPFLNTTDGPVVLEIPPAGDAGAIIGTLMDAWQVPLEDVGKVGVDQGAGGKYLVLPPGYDAAVPDGYIALPAQTYAAYALLRSSIAGGSDEQVAAAVEYGKQVRVYSLAEAADPAPTVFHDAADTLFDATIPYELGFYQALDRFIEAEPWQTRDKVMIDMLKSIGIAKGSPFAPDDDAARILTDAAADGRAWLDAQYQRFFADPFFPGTGWALPAPAELVQAAGDGYSAADSYPVDARGGGYYWAFSAIKHMGAGQFYLMTISDDQGNPLDGARSYRLTVPADPPVTLYWSATAYDRQTHALIPDVPRASRSSTSPGLQTNADGAVDLHIGPTAPDGSDGNWLLTAAGRDFEVLVRFYGPQQALFEKTWRLPDITAAP